MVILKKYIIAEFEKLVPVQKHDPEQFFVFNRKQKSGFFDER